MTNYILADGIFLNLAAVATIADEGDDKDPKIVITTTAGAEIVFGGDDANAILDRVELLERETSLAILRMQQAVAEVEAQVAPGVTQ